MNRDSANETLTQFIPNRQIGQYEKRLSELTYEGNYNIVGIWDGIIIWIFLQNFTNQ